MVKPTLALLLSHSNCSPKPLPKCIRLRFDPKVTSMCPLALELVKLGPNGGNAYIPPWL